MSIHLVWPTVLPTFIFFIILKSIISGHNCQATYAVKKEQFHTEIGLLQKLLLWVCDLNPLITGFKPVNKTALSGPYI